MKSSIQLFHVKFKAFGVCVEDSGELFALHSIIEVPAGAGKTSTEIIEERFNQKNLGPAFGALALFLIYAKIKLEMSEEFSHSALQILEGDSDTPAKSLATALIPSGFRRSKWLKALLGGTDCDDLDRLHKSLIERIFYFKSNAPAQVGLKPPYPNIFIYRRSEKNSHQAIKRQNAPLASKCLLGEELKGIAEPILRQIRHKKNIWKSYKIPEELRSSYAQRSSTVSSALNPKYGPIEAPAGKYYDPLGLVSQLGAAVRSESVDSILIFGLGGIGKTALVSQVINPISQRNDYEVYVVTYYDTPTVGRGNTSKQFLSLQDYDKEIASTLLAPKKAENITALKALEIQNMKGVKTIVLLDKLEFLAPIDRVKLMGGLGRWPNVTFVGCSRSHIKDFQEYISLKGLPPEESWSLFLQHYLPATKGFDDIDRRKVFEEISQGDEEKAIFTRKLFPNLSVPLVTTILGATCGIRGQKPSDLLKDSTTLQTLKSNLNDEEIEDFVRRLVLQIIARIEKKTSDLFYYLGTFSSAPIQVEFVAGLLPSYKLHSPGALYTLRSLSLVRVKPKQATGYLADQDYWIFSHEIIYQISRDLAVHQNDLLPYEIEAADYFKKFNKRLQSDDYIARIYELDHIGSWLNFYAALDANDSVSCRISPFRIVTYKEELAEQYRKTGNSGISRSITRSLLDFYRLDLKKAIEKYGWSSTMTRDIANQLAIACNETDNFREAEDLFKKIIEYEESQSDSEINYLNETKIEYAYVCFRTGKYREAESKIIEIINSPKYRDASSNAAKYSDIQFLALTKLKQGSFRDAKQKFDQYSEYIHDKNEDYAQARTTTILSQIECLIGLEDIDLALQLYNTNLGGTNKSMGFAYMSDTQACVIQAFLYLICGKLKKAEHLLKTILESLKDVLDDESLTTTQRALASTYIHLGKMDLAVSLLQKIFNTTREVYGYENDKAQSDALRLAGALERTGQIEESTKLSKFACAFFLREYGASNIKYEYAKQLTASLYLHMDDPELCLELANQEPSGDASRNHTVVIGNLTLQHLAHSKAGNKRVAEQLRLKLLHLLRNTRSNFHHARCVAYYATFLHYTKNPGINLMKPSVEDLEDVYNSFEKMLCKEHEPTFQQFRWVAATFLSLDPSFQEHPLSFNTDLKDPFDGRIGLASYNLLSCLSLC